MSTLCETAATPRRRVATHVTALSLTVSIGFLLFLSACSQSAQPTPVSVTPEAPTPPVVTPPLDPARNGLRGDPDFDPEQIRATVAPWYLGLLDDIDGHDGEAMYLAGKDNVYDFGRTLHSHVQAILIAFRLTGDLALLDHVDAIAERMRRDLRDEWRGTLDGTDGTKDGYLNWVSRKSGEKTYDGKDFLLLDEMKTHAMIAMIAVALDANRDLESPSGRDYASHADFWRDYLVDHFEAKWRDRRDVASGFPIMVRPHTHTYYSWMKWHYYMGQLTGDAAYTAEATRMAAVLWEELRPVETPSGTAYVWARSVLEEGGGDNALHPTTYARYVFGDVVELHLAGFDRWASPTEMERFARTVTEFVMDSSDPARNGFARDIGGGTSRAGLPSVSSWSRLTSEGFAYSAYALIGAWDPGTDIPEITEDLDEDFSESTFLSLARFLQAAMDEVDAPEVSGP